MLKGHFSWTNVTSNSVVVSWNSTIFLEKGVNRLIFAAITNEPAEKPLIFSSSVGAEILVIGSLEPSRTYLFNVIEDDLINPTIEIDIINTLPTGIYLC